MPMNTNISTEGFEPIERTFPKAMPALSAPAKSPFFVSNFPISGPNNSYQAANFSIPNVPSGVVSAPPLNQPGSQISADVTQAPKLLTQVPAPTISSPLVSIAAGYSFAYREVRLPLGATLAISSYKIYRNSVNISASASVIQTNPHNINGISTPVVVTDNVPNGVTMFYWVSAVSTSGQESNLTPAQSGTVANTAIANANSQLASSFNGVPLSATWIPTNTTTISNDGSHTFITVTSHTDQFGPGQISYNSGTIDPLFTGTFYVFCKDPTFAGGAVTYHVAGNGGGPLTAIAQGDSVIVLGAIVTSTGSSSSGGGTTGGTSAAPVSSGGGGLGSGASGGRGIGSVIVQV